MHTLHIIADMPKYYHFTIIISDQPNYKTPNNQAPYSQCQEIIGFSVSQDQVSPNSETLRHVELFIFPRHSRP